MDERDKGTAIERLIALLKAGYRIDQSASIAVGDSVWLEHPSGRRIAYATLTLNGDGFLVSALPVGKSNQLRIAPEKSSDFWSFVNTVPQPSWWDLHKGSFYGALGWLLTLIFVPALGALLYFPLKAIANLLGLSDK